MKPSSFKHSKLAELVNDRSGNFAMMTGLLAVPLLLAAGKAGAEHDVDGIDFKQLAHSVPSRLRKVSARAPAPRKAPSRSKEGRDSISMRV